MRVSIDKRDKGYRFRLDPKRVRVYFNDVLCNQAITADEEENLIIVRKLDENGMPIVDKERKGFVLETIYGKVKIEILADNGESLRTPKVVLERINEGLSVLVYSRISPRNIRRTIIENYKLVGLGVGASKLCGVVAGAAAEVLCDLYGDVFDPSYVAFIASEEYKKLMAIEKQVTQH